MVKDLEYFLEEENRFCSEHPDYGDFFYDENIGESSNYGIDDRLNYLSEKIFSKTAELIRNKNIKVSNSYEISEAQIVILGLFHWKYSYIFRDDYYYDDITDFVQNLFDTLDDLVNKAPINNDTTLYRFCNDYDKSDMVIGDLITIPHNLTCTNYDWKQEKYNNVYVITPLKNNKTKAHNLFEIYKHGDEFQVNFLRNTTFRVYKVEHTEGTDFKKFYLEEVQGCVHDFVQIAPK